MLHSKMKQLLSLFFCLCFSSCGYHAAGQASNESVANISIPLIKDDEDGVLRNAIARAIASTRKFSYTSGSSSRELIVAFESNYTDTIGYEWDVKTAKGGEVKRLYPDEGRKTIVAVVTLQDSKTKEPILEPFKIKSQVEYDFVNPISAKEIEFKDLFGKEQMTLQYSLGQLDSEEGARSEAHTPLFQDLAGKIVDGLSRAPAYKRDKNEGK
jgi:hypothetical protein